MPAGCAAREPGAPGLPREAAASVGAVAGAARGAAGVGGGGGRAVVDGGLLRRPRTCRGVFCAGRHVRRALEAQ